MKYHVYTAIIYSQKSIIPKIIDSLVRAIAIKLTPKKKKPRSSPIPSPLKTNTLYHDPRSNARRKNGTTTTTTKKTKIQKQSQTHFHYIISPSHDPVHPLPRFTIPAIRARLNGSTPHIAPAPSPHNTVLIRYATCTGGE